jgi:MFS family permease
MLIIIEPEMYNHVSGSDASQRSGTDHQIMQSGPSIPKNSAFPRTILLALLTIATFLNPFAGSSINLALPLIGDEFGIDAVMLSWVPATYLLSSAVFLLPAGKMGDILGRITVFRIGTTVYTVASFLTIFTPSTPFLLGCRFMQGFGSAMIFSTAVAIISELYQPGERGKALGLNVTAIYAGLTTGPFLGGLLTQFFGWRSIFVVTVILGGCILPFLDRFPSSLNRKISQSFDLSGSILSSVVLITFFIGLSGINSIPGLIAVFVSVVLAIVFFSTQRRKEHPIIPLSLLGRTPAFARMNLAALINYSATFAVTFLMSLYLQVVRGFGPAAAGSLLLIQPLVQMVCSPVAGRLSDRIEPSLLATTGMMISAGSLLWMSFFNAGTPVEMIAGALICLGIGLALFSSPNTNAIMGTVDRHDYGTASALLAMMRSLGMMLSMSIVMVFFSLVLGATVITPDQSTEFLVSMHFALITCFVLTGIGAALSRRGRRGAGNAGVNT